MLKVITKWEEGYQDLIGCMLHSNAEEYGGEEIVGWLDGCQNNIPVKTPLLSFGI